MAHFKYMHVVLALAVLANVTCTSAYDPAFGQTSRPILGGSSVDAANDPTVALLIGSSICSGVLISPTVVLTAAHCIDPTLTQMPDQAAVTAATTAVIGADDVFNPSQGASFKAAQTIPNPAFDSANPLGPDLGLVVLATAVTGRAPASLKVTTGDDLVGTDVTLFGYGTSRTNNGTPDPNSAGRLLAVDQSAIDCTGTTDNATALCYDQSDGKGTCVGDSGGPSFATISGQTVVVGIHSFGDVNCASISIDVRVDSQLPFIGKTLCAQDGSCAADCGQGGLEADPDCKFADGGPDGADAGAEPPGTSADASAPTDGAGEASAGANGDAGTNPNDDASDEASTAPDSGAEHPDAEREASVSNEAEADGGASAAAMDAGTTPSTSTEDGGCGCRVARPAQRASSWGTAALCLVAMCGLRRRKRARATRSSWHDAR